jgi:hypothetical protein
MITVKLQPSTVALALDSVVLHVTGHLPVTLSPRPRGHHAPVHVSHEIEQVLVEITATDPFARLELQDAPTATLVGERLARLALAVGMNRYRARVVSGDGESSRDFSFKVIRDQPQPRWRRVVEQAPWRPRDSAGELVFADRFWLLGGFIPQLANDVWSSADGLAWTREGDVPTTCGIDMPVAFVLNLCMFVADVDGNLFRSCDGRTWTLATSSAPWAGRANCGCAVLGDRVLVMGGRDRQGRLCNDVWSSSDGVNWSLLTPEAPWCARQIHHTPLLLDGWLYLLGGGALGPDYYPFIAWNDVWRTRDGRQWEQVLEHAPWSPRIWGASAVFRDRLWLLGGFRSDPTWENLGDIWHSSDGRQWHRLDHLPDLRHAGANNQSYQQGDTCWDRRHEHSVWVRGETLWLAGGMVWPLCNDVWRLDLPGLCFLTQPVLETVVGGQYEYIARADFHRSRRPLRYVLRQGPAWLRIDSGTGQLQGRAGEAGQWPVLLEATDDAGESVRQSFTLNCVAL